MYKNGMIHVKMVATQSYDDKITKGKVYDGWYDTKAKNYQSIHFNDNYKNNTSVYLKSCKNGEWFNIVNPELNKNIRTL